MGTEILEPIDAPLLPIVIPPKSIDTQHVGNHHIKLNSIRCPSCSANVSISPGAHSVRCEYCGTESIVQKSSDQQQNVPSRNYDTPCDDTPLYDANNDSVGWLPKILSLSIFAVAVVFFLVQQGFLGQSPLNTEQGSSSKMRINGTYSPIPGDVNQDGIEDLIIVRDHVEKDHTVDHIGYLTSIDGKTGKPIWNSPPLDPKSLRFSIEDSTIVAGNHLGQIQAMDAALGTVKWQQSLKSQVAYFCSCGLDCIAAHFENKQVRGFALATGDTMPATSCDPLWNSGRSSNDGPPWMHEIQGGAHASDELDDKDFGLKDISFVRVWRWQGGRDREKSDRIVLAYDTSQRHRSPMLLRHTGLNGAKLVWQSKIPRGNPLSVSSDPIRNIVISPTRIVLAYQTIEPPDQWRIAGFRLDSGVREFDFALKDADGNATRWSPQIVASKDRFYLIWHGKLVAYSNSTQRVIWTMEG